MSAVLLHTDLPGLPEPRVGKVREVYDLGDELLIVSTDRISAFDVIMANGVPDKGRVLNQLSAYWFRKLAHICPNHMLTTDDNEISCRVGMGSSDLKGRSMIVKKATTVPVECVVRGYITGSLLKEYRREGGSVHGLRLPEGLEDGSKLPEPIFTPATKASEGHDENISFDQMVSTLGKELGTQLRDWSLNIYLEASEFAATRGFILADTKFEFGTSPEGVMWIDEALTPDSSRFWEASQWQPGRAQPSFDKQFVRDYLEATGWDKRPPGPILPDDVIAGTRAKYLEAFRRITGHELSL